VDTQGSQVLDVIRTRVGGPGLCRTLSRHLADDPDGFGSTTELLTALDAGHPTDLATTLRSRFPRILTAPLGGAVAGASVRRGGGGESLRESYRGLVRRPTTHQATGKAIPASASLKTSPKTKGRNPFPIAVERSKPVAAISHGMPTK
jgi:hypothetical protein